MPLGAFVALVNPTDHKNGCLATLVNFIGGKSGRLLLVYNNLGLLTVELFVQLGKRGDLLVLALDQPFQAFLKSDLHTDVVNYFGSS